MEQIINIQEHSAFILFMVIVLVVWIASRYEPKMKMKLAELDILQAVQRLEADFQNARDLEQLERLESFIDTIYQNAKKVSPVPHKYSERLLSAWHTRYWDLTNDYPGIPQNLLPKITLI